MCSGEKKSVKLSEEVAGTHLFTEKLRRSVPQPAFWWKTHAKGLCKDEWSGLHTFPLFAPSIRNEELKAFARLWSGFYRAIMSQLQSLDAATPQQVQRFAGLPEKTPHNHWLPSVSLRRKEGFSFKRNCLFACHAAGSKPCGDACMQSLHCSVSSDV